MAAALGVRRQSVALWEAGEQPGPVNMRALRDLFGAELLEPVETPSAVALAYWRGRVEQIARHMAAVLRETEALAADMGTTAPGAVSPTEEVADLEQVHAHYGAAKRPRRKRG